MLLKWLLVLLSATFFLFADSLSANWGKTGHVGSILLMIVLAPLGYWLFGILNKTVSLGVSSSLVNLLIILGGVLVGWFYFGEILGVRQILGIFMAIVAIILLS